MENNNKTSWRKNLDSRYISGEDLVSGLRGFKPEMVVVIERFSDTDTFDQTTQKTAIKTGFYLRELNGQMLHKPLILNKKNAEYCEKEFKSIYMEDWIGKPIVLYAQADKRFGHVARFKKYYPQAHKTVEPPKPVEVNVDEIVLQIELITELPQLAQYWSGLDIPTKNIEAILKAKDKRKSELENGNS